MNQLQLYPEAWAVYILLGLGLLFLLHLALRSKPFALKAGLLSAIGVLAFTPETVLEGQTLAPKIITRLLNAEVQGIETLYQGIITLAIIWGIVFALLLALHYWRLGKQKSHSPQTSVETEAR